MYNYAKMKSLDEKLKHTRFNIMLANKHLEDLEKIIISIQIERTECKRGLKE